MKHEIFAEASVIKILFIHFHLLELVTWTGAKLVQTHG